MRMRKSGLIVMAAVSIILLTGCNGIIKERIIEDRSVSRKEEISEAPETEKRTLEEVQESEEVQEREALEEAQKSEAEQEFTDLHIEISEGTLYIRSGDSFSLTRHNGEKVDYKIEGGTLFFEKNHAEDVILTLPEELCYKKLELIVGNGHAYVESTLTVDTLKLEVDRGEVSLDHIVVLNDSTVNIKDGAAFVSGETGSTMTAVCNQGNLNLSVPFEESDCNYEIEVSGGNIRVGNHSYQGKNKTDSVNNNGNYSMGLSCTHGNITVVFKDK